ncbi:isoprenylcysteine carboxylmethyltransferase family protein [Gallaecimonas kandeliae]|uniref:methyltransferase family protein n=1 Tax=Gallaecimonas kandeliae TaxID=3029055 RepID=UPI002649DA3A|nr:isoprenylcysteine carboxylmethyltransferase family protein [Gallaecimonas kandeliae]WKE64103.1 isoprenylcysteine carboxylmethyltransferase family protein [Gallaecimonas kandeliae]
MAGPGIRFPPPLLFVLGFLLGLGLDQLYPAPLRPLVWLLVAAGLVVITWALLTFRAAKTPVIPTKDANALVTKGPYRFSRNPMYLGLSLVYLGLALWLQSLFSLLLLPAVLYSLWWLAIRREERHLEERFGQAYLDYKARVRRWF